MKTTAIILSAGKGKRMGTGISKQYLMLEGYPVIYYTLKAFEESEVDNIILVTGKEEETYCRNDIVDFYGFKKVKKIVTGGKERYNSVYNGLKAIEKNNIETDIVLIHDGARAFVTGEIISATIKGALEHRACVAAVKAKDTIKISDKEGFIEYTPERESVWQIQTPQTFQYELIKKAYEKVMSEDPDGITDDAMVLERFGEKKIKLVEASYKNIKLTTPEDMHFARVLLDK